MVQRIKQLAEVEFHITPKVLRQSVFNFCNKHGVQHQFNKIRGSAVRTWLRGFLQRHPNISKGKVQNFNEARAQKLNRSIVHDYFGKLKIILQILDIMNKSERIFNVDEKNCHVSLRQRDGLLFWLKKDQRGYITEKKNMEKT